MSQRFIYFIKPIGMDGPIKIGCSASPQNRLQQLMTWSPFDLEIITTILGSLKLERNIHECFAAEYTRREWFRASDRLKDFVAKVAAGVPVAEAVDLSARTSISNAKKTPEFKLRMSYTHRLRWAAAKLEGNTRGLSCVSFYPPDDVAQIMGHWSGYRSGQGAVPQRNPSPADFARLDAVLSNPAAHFTSRTLRTAA